MDIKIDELKKEFEKKLSEISDLKELDSARVSYLGKKGSITADSVGDIIMEDAVMECNGKVIIRGSYV